VLTYDVALEVIALGKRVKGKYPFVTRAESGHHPCESISSGAESVSHPGPASGGATSGHHLRCLAR